MTEKQFIERKNRIERQAENARQVQELKEFKKTLFPEAARISTSKKILIGATVITIFILLIATITIFMFQWQEALLALVAAPATLIPIFWKYYSKAEAENTVGGITYEKAMLEEEPEDEEEYEVNEDDEELN